MTAFPPDDAPDNSSPDEEDTEEYTLVGDGVSAITG